MFAKKNRRDFSFICLSIVFCSAFCLLSSTFAEDKVQVEKANDTESSLEAAKKFPANKWVINEIKIVIPEKWNKGRYCYVNSYASIVFCNSIGAAITMDGYTYTPAGKSILNNYSDSVYVFHPMRNEYELFKRNNWRAGARSTDPEKTSYPFDENKTDQTPCPRHLYRGITYLEDTDTFYLINGANAGVPNEHPKYKENNGTDTHTFWGMNVSTKTWKQLELPSLKRMDPYETVLMAMPSTGKLIYFDAWSVASYDAKSAKWSVMMGNDGRPVKSQALYCASLVDSKRHRMVFYGGPGWRTQKDVAPVMTKTQLSYYDMDKNTNETINGTGDIDIEFDKIRPCAYLSDIDKYLYVTNKGHYIFDPNKNQWKKLKIELPNIPFSWCYMTYDVKRKLLILNDGYKWAVMRLDEKTFEFE